MNRTNLVLQVRTVYLLVAEARKTIDNHPASPYNPACFCGNNSVVECQLPKLKVAGSNPVSRSSNCEPRFLPGIGA